VGLILVLGLLTAAGAGAWAGATIAAARERAREISQLNTAVARFNAEVTRFNAVVAQHDAAVTREQQAASAVTSASDALSNAHDTFYAALNSPSANADNCLTVSCFNETSWPDVKAFAAFGSTLRETPVPTGSAAIAKRLLTETAGSEQDYREMAVATSFSSIEDEATAAENVGEKFDSDYQALITSLGNVLTTLGNEGVTLNNAGITLNQEAAALSRQGAALSRQATVLNVKISLRAATTASS
jgi:hypothetical protein